MAAVLSYKERAGERKTFEIIFKIKKYGAPYSLCAVFLSDTEIIQSLVSCLTAHLRFIPTIVKILLHYM